MKEKEDISKALTDLDVFLDDLNDEVEDDLIDPSSIPFSGTGTVPVKMRYASTLRGSDLYTDSRSECSGVHRGQALKGIPTLLASSYRHGLAIPGGSITVILASEALSLAFPAGWASSRTPEFNSHLRGALVYWPWKDFSAPGDVEQSTRRVLELHEEHVAGKIIEVACFGGHGRTGTLLAILAALHQGWPEHQAVDRLRQAYCKRAVETPSQEQFVCAVIARARDLMKH